MSRWRAVAALLAALTAGAAERWQARPLPSPKGARWQVADLKFSSPAWGIAAGCIQRGSSCVAASAVTRDGGRTWVLHTMPAVASSLFFLDETTGWMTGARALFKTTDGGLTWSRLPDSEATANAFRVYFATEEAGWAVGQRKSAFATKDGGTTWSRISAAETVNTTPENTSYLAIAFADRKSGMIVGASNPPRRDAGPRARELPHLGIFVDTRDGGETWRASTASMFGSVTRLAFAPDGRGLGLIQFAGDFDYPSEVFRIDWKTGESTRAFRDARCAVTDVIFLSSGAAMMAGVNARRVGERGRIRLLRSADLAEWEDMPVAGRPAARRVILAEAGRAVWAATDDGLLLSLSSP